MPKKTTRRQFLRGRPSADAPGPTAGKDPPGANVDASNVDASAGGAPIGASPQESVLIHVSRQAMAGRFELFFNAGQYPNDTEAALAALDCVQTLEEQMSYFRGTSEISRINALAAEMPMEVEPRLFELLQSCMDLHRQTEGAFDIAAAPIWEAWGFSQRAGRIPTDEELADARARTGSRLVALDPESRTVQFTRPGVRLNLGAVGKGYALDRAAEVLESAHIKDFLFHGGQSSILARGARAEAGRGQPGSRLPGWSVGIRHPLKPQERIGELWLRDRALGTSGSAMQYFRHQGRRYSHILDPRTGWPAEGVLSATVLAPSAALADALSTAFFVLGPDWTQAFCRTRPEIAAVLVCSTRDRHGHEIRTAGDLGGQFRPT